MINAAPSGSWFGWSTPTSDTNQSPSALEVGVSGSVGTNGINGDARASSSLGSASVSGNLNPMYVCYQFVNCSKIVNLLFVRCKL